MPPRSARDVVADDVSTIPVAEVSGLALGRTASGAWLVAVGDEANVVLIAPLLAGGVGPWRTIDLTGRHEVPSTGSNFEAVAVDDGGTIVVLSEHPAALVIAADEGSGAVRSVAIDVRSATRLTGGKGRVSAEGLVLLRQGHVAVAHKRRPVGILELGPPGQAAIGIGPDAWLPPDELFAIDDDVDGIEALGWWPVADVDDISDLVVWDGDLYGLSEHDECIVRLTVGPVVAVADRWRFERGPERIRYGDAEGLCVAPDGACFVAFDRDEGTPNLARFAPLV